MPQPGQPSNPNLEYSSVLPAEVVATEKLISRAITILKTKDEVLAALNRFTPKLGSDKDEMPWSLLEKLDLQTAPYNKGTIVRIFLHDEQQLKDFFNKFTGEDVDTLLQKTLKQFKSFLETGEIPTTTGQPSGREQKYEPSMVH